MEELLGAWVVHEVQKNDVVKEESKDEIEKLGDKEVQKSEG
jgi:hypothetical protein